MRSTSIDAFFDFSSAMSASPPSSLSSRSDPSADLSTGLVLEGASSSSGSFPRKAWNSENPSE